MGKAFARKLRQKMTDAEMRLWFFLRPLRQHGLAFRRQSPLGPYVVDFECRRAKLCVELDGSGHGASDVAAYDAERTRWLEIQGYKVLRFWNHDVLKLSDVVFEQIRAEAERRAKERYPDE